MAKKKKGGQQQQQGQKKKDEIDVEVEEGEENEVQFQKRISRGEKRKKWRRKKVMIFVEIWR